MDNTNDDYLNRVYEGDYANHGATVFEPLTRAVSQGYQDLAARGAPGAAAKRDGFLRPMEMAGSMGGQMPTADKGHHMNQSLGLTSRRFGATAPDPKGVEAIASRTIDQMGLMEPEDTMALTPAQNSRQDRAYAPRLGSMTGRGGTAFSNQAGGEGHGREKGASLPKQEGVQDVSTRQWWDNAAKTAAFKPLPDDPASEKDMGLIRQLASDIGNERFQKIVAELAKLAARLPGEIAKARQAPHSTAYLDYLTGNQSGKR